MMDFLRSKLKSSPTTKIIPIDPESSANQADTSTVIHVPETSNAMQTKNLHRLPSSGPVQRKSIRPSIDLSSSGTVSFHEINYIVGGSSTSVDQKKSCLPCIKPKPAKQVLTNVSGLFTPGMNAIMGPSGCGKSSLLDILADRKDPRGLSGSVLVNGLPPPPSFKYIVGYVVQDDIISGNLTVRENLIFSANVRLPSEFSKEERQTRVEKIIDDLGLESCANTRIGTESLRGISGGERKRTCIGMELVLEPKILFLDEPTTGLDASTARSVMECLSKLSKQGRTIIFSIHQPRYSTFKIFDTALFLCKGLTIYRGPADGIVPYFATQGYHCEMYDNPADFALDSLIEASRHAATLEKLHEAYESSSMHTSVTALTNKQPDDNNQFERLRRQQKGQAARPIPVEIYYVSQRTLKNVLRNPQLLLSQTMIAIILGLLVGVVFFNLASTTDPGVQNRLGTLFFIIMNQIFSTLSALVPLIEERALFVHENVSGYYRIITFFIAKLLCDILPMRLIPATIFSLIAYFMTGLQRTAGRFFTFFVTVFMASVFGSSVGFFAAASFGSFAVAQVFCVLIFILMMVFCGFLIDLNSVFNWLSWIQWISGFRYALNTLIINEFHDSTFCLANATNICPLSGSDVLSARGLSYSTDWDMWKYFFALTMMTLTFLILAFIQLVRIKKTK